MSRKSLLIVLAVCILQVNSFQVFLNVKKNFRSRLFAGGPEEDFPLTGDKKYQPPRKDVDKPANVYRDQPWKLNEQDQDYDEQLMQLTPRGREALALRKKILEDRKEALRQNFTSSGLKFYNNPLFALIYKFDDKYSDPEKYLVNEIEQHVEVAKKTPYIKASYVYNTKKGRGSVAYFHGFKNQKKEDIEKVIYEFMKKDPFIVGKFVERWQILDLTSTEERHEVLKKIKELEEKNKAAASDPEEYVRLRKLMDLSRRNKLKSPERKQKIEALLKERFGEQFIEGLKAQAAERSKRV